MKLLFTSTSYPSNALDWRGQFIRHMVYSLTSNPQIELSLWAPPGEIPENARYCATANEARWLQKLTDKGGIANLLRNNPVKGTLYAVKLLSALSSVYKRSTDIDLIHVNWLQNALPLKNDSKPLVVSVLGTDFQLLKLPGMIKALSGVFRNKKCVICPNASWMTQPLQNYFGQVAEVRHMPYGIDNRLFELHAENNQPQTMKWLTIVRVTKDKIGPLFEWGQDIADENNAIHLLGPNQDKLEIPPWCQFEGPTNPDELITHWLPSATGLITLSRHAEGLPQIILESMAAGVPVIASDIPAHRNIIQHKESGWLVTSRESFEQGVSWLSSMENRKYVASNARQWVKKNFGSWQDCANRFFNLYEHLVH